MSEHTRFWGTGPPQRSIVQMCANDVGLFVLCYDGTIWRSISIGIWERVPGPPEEEKA
jgi:hypothetical protein